MDKPQNNRYIGIGIKKDGYCLTIGGEHIGRESCSAPTVIYPKSGDDSFCMCGLMGIIVRLPCRNEDQMLHYALTITANAREKLGPERVDTLEATVNLLNTPSEQMWRIQKQ